MSDGKDLDQPVRIEIKLFEWKWANNHSYSKTIEIDREDWDAMSEYEREQHIEEYTADFRAQCLESDYEILSDDDISDVAGAE